MYCITPGFPVLHYLLKFVQTPSKCMCDSNTDLFLLILSQYHPYVTRNQRNQVCIITHNAWNWWWQSRWIMTRSAKHTKAKLVSQESLRNISFLPRQSVCRKLLVLVNKQEIDSLSGNHGDTNLGNCHNKHEKHQPTHQTKSKTIGGIGMPPVTPFFPWKQFSVLLWTVTRGPPQHAFQDTSKTWCHVGIHARKTVLGQRHFKIKFVRTKLNFCFSP